MVVQHPTVIVVILALYPVYSVIVTTDNSFKARAYDHKTDLSDIYRAHDKMFLFGLPLAVFVISSIFAYRGNVGLKAWLYAAPLATGLMFLALASAYKIGAVGDRKRIGLFAILIVVFAIIDLYIYGDLVAVGYGLVAGAVLGGMIYILMPRIRLIRDFLASRYMLFLSITALYSFAVISTFLYALAALLWDWMQISSK